MLLIGILLFSASCNSIVSSLQINMYSTSREGNGANQFEFEHDCLRTPVYMEDEGDAYQIISYCLTE